MFWACSAIREAVPVTVSLLHFPFPAELPGLGEEVSVSMVPSFSGHAGAAGT